MNSQVFYSTCVPSQIKCISIVVDELITSLLNIHGDVDAAILFELRVILNEAMLNAVRHGNREDEHKLVKVDARVSIFGEMVIIVEDEGIGFNYENICECRRPYCGIENMSEMSEHGRGIILIKGLSDNVETNEKGNRIIISKSIL